MCKKSNLPNLRFWFIQFVNLDFYSFNHSFNIFWKKSIHFFVKGSHSIKKLFIQKRFLLIHSKKIFFFFKTGVSARANLIKPWYQVVFELVKYFEVFEYLCFWVQIWCLLVGRRGDSKYTKNIILFQIAKYNIPRAVCKNIKQMFKCYIIPNSQIPHHQ